jgi:hypothetical protein
VSIPASLIMSNGKINLKAEAQVVNMGDVSRLEHMNINGH